MGIFEAAFLNPRVASIEFHDLGGRYRVLVTWMSSIIEYQLHDSRQSWIP